MWAPPLLEITQDIQDTCCAEKTDHDHAPSPPLLTICTGAPQGGANCLFDEAEAEQ